MEKQDRGLNEKILKEVLSSGNSEITALKRIRPVLIFKMSNNGLSQAEANEMMYRFGEQINRLNMEDEYINLLFITEDREHSVEMLNPNVNTEEEADLYLAKLDELRKTMNVFFENQQEK